MRRLIILLLLAAAVIWGLRNRPTLGGLIDRLTSPLFQSKAAVDESEHKRVVAEAVPAIHQDEEVPIGMLREGMSPAEVRGILGQPESISEFRQGGRHRLRWDYPRIRRRVDFEDGRVVSIAIR